jgi:U3 small nucleolar RNA-associated protein 20
LDENNGIIHSDHRAKLLPILMRLLYGKFHSHETTHTSSRDTKTNKRSTIIQFLSSCSEYELNYFFNLIFDCINTIGGINTVESKNLKIENGIEDRVMVEDEANDRFEINDNSYDSNKKDYLLAKLQLKLNDTKSEASIYNLKCVIPIKKILGILQSLEIIIKKLGRQMENFAHRILQMLGFMYKYTHTINEILFNQKGSNKSYEYHMSLIKIVRQKITLRVKEFFDTFDQLNFTQQEYFFIFDSFIWPQSVKIPAESLKSVSNLLKIFSLWSERSKYYPLFVVKIADFNAIDSNLVASLESCAKNDSSQMNIMDYFKTKSLLDVLFELIDNAKCSQAVIDFVLEIVHNLVTFADFKIEDKQEEEMSKGDEITKELPFELEPYKADLKNYSSIEFFLIFARL